MDNITINMSKLQKDTLINFLNCYFPDMKLIFAGVVLFSLLTAIKPSIGTTLFLSYHTSHRLLLIYSDLIKNSSIVRRISKLELTVLVEIRKSIKALKRNIIMNKHAMNLRFSETYNDNIKYKALFIKKCLGAKVFFDTPPCTHSKAIALTGVIFNRGIIIGYAGYITLQTMSILRQTIYYLDESTYLFDSTVCLTIIGTIPLMQYASIQNIKYISTKLLMPFYKEYLDVDQRNCEPIITSDMIKLMKQVEAEMQEEIQDEINDNEGYNSDISDLSSNYLY